MATRTKKTEEITNEIIETEDIKSEKSTITNQRRREVRKKINNDTEILIMNNVATGSMFYKCPTKGTIYEFNHFGDTDYITYEELNIMKNRHRGILEKYWIMPIEVDSEEVTLQDVIDALGISNLYTEEMLYEDNIDYILLNTNLRAFKRILDEVNERYLQRVTERAVLLFKEGKLVDYTKIQTLEKAVGKEDLFKEVLEHVEE